MNEKEICVIMCVNNEKYMQEAAYYITQLHIPDGYEISFLTIADARSMTAGYNEAMQASNAKYKVYLHQDTFILNPYFLDDCIRIFESDTKIGMIGMIGIPQMPESGIMWDGRQYGRVLETHIFETIIRGNGFNKELNCLDVEAVDGLLLMTSYDLPWREDLFDHWDFYDASQAMEFWKKGYRVVIPQMKDPWVLHDCGLLNKDRYEQERQKYIKEYLGENRIQTAAKPRKEIVFLPYKASMWDSLESVWKKECEDLQNDVYVIPIPYFDKNQNGKVCAMHYEGDQFPDYVPITPYQEYSIEKKHPDRIYIHNPYDEHNIVTTVHPNYYAAKLREQTGELIYIPYFVLEEKEFYDLAAISHFATTSGVVNAHKVIVQSDAMKKAYIEALVQWAGEESRSIWEKKMEGSGSPKLEKLKNTKKEELEIPEEWKNIIDRGDGERKKIILYNNSIGTFLREQKKVIEKIQRVLLIFEEQQERIALLWRPHPLMEATIKSTCPELWEEYERIVRNYKEAQWSIYDDTADLDRAVVLSDAYYGDMSSVVELFKVLNKPIMIQEVEC